MLKFSQSTVRFVKNSSRFHQVLGINKFSTSASIAEGISYENQIDDTKVMKLKQQKLSSYKSENNMVAAAFASLHAEPPTLDIKTPFTDNKISRAKSVDELLSISEGSGISRRHALNVVSVLSEWSSSGKVNLSDFENDPRFLKLCRVLTKGAKFTKGAVSRSEDLSTILSVTADDEAAKLVASITVPQMVKVMSTLSQKRRRSTLLLRALAYNITGSSDQLDLKQSADLLYSMCTLNFVDENLLAKVSADICNDLNKELKTSSVVGSVVTSFGLLKYKNSETLDALSDWILKYQSACRPQDIFSLFVTLAVLNYTPSNAEQLFTTLLPQLTQSEARSPLVWLNIVWSLVLLNQATTAHVSSVLSESFVEKVEGSKTLRMSTKLKLLNINGAASYLLPDYVGPKLSSTSGIHNVSITRTKEKEEMVDGVIDTLKNLIQTESNIDTRVNTSLGFVIDAVCVLDKKCSPQSMAELNSEKEGVVKVAFMSFDYHDMCKGGKADVFTGVNAFAIKLLEAQGYRVLTIPYTEFTIQDKLIHRVQYLEAKLKGIVK